MPRLTYLEKYPHDLKLDIEVIKQEGWKKIRESKNPNEQYHYLLENIIWSHYWRARYAIENSSKPRTLLKKIRGKKYYSKYILDIDHYTKYWNFSNGDRHDLFSLEVKNLLDNHYPEEECKYMPKGYTTFIFS